MSTGLISLAAGVLIGLMYAVLSPRQSSESLDWMAVAGSQNHAGFHEREYRRHHARCGRY
ncbi:hypothetical protein AAIE16_23760 [Enterobacter hormaechei]|uniref:hypothetical protein n=1 Tax=Enterobacter hormaechei TaxID=158836 RepID=UPI003F47B7C3